MPSPACDQCFRRKHPCLGGRPSCEQCLKTGLTCTYSTGKPVGKPKGHKKSRTAGSTSSAGSSSSMRCSPLPVRLQPHASTTIDSSRESSVSASSMADIDIHTPKKRKTSHPPGRTSTGPTSSGTFHGGLTDVAFNAFTPAFSTSTDYSWNATSSSLPGTTITTTTTGEDPMLHPVTSSFKHYLPQPMLTAEAWMPHSDLLEWQALLDQSSIIDATHSVPTTVLDGASLYTEPPLISPNASEEYGIIPHISPTSTSNQSPCTSLKSGGSTSSSSSSTTIYRSCEFKDSRGTDDKHLEAIRDTLSCVQSALQWPSCRDINCLDVCLMDCILALQQCVECLNAVVSGHNRHQQSYPVVRMESPRLQQMHLIYTLAQTSLKEVEHLTMRSRQLLEFRGEGGYLMPLVVALENSIWGLAKKLHGYGVVAWVD